MADISADLQQELDQMQAAYKAAVDEWVKAIRDEEALASRNHSVAELDKWEAAYFHENKMQQGSDYKKKPLRRRAASRILRLLIPSRLAIQASQTSQRSSSPDNASARLRGA